MSNPAVFRLNKIKIRDNIISIEDNIGESIHFHLGLVRFDLTINEFNNITETLMNILNKQVDIKDFNLIEQNEYFLERIAPIIPYITAVEDVSVNVEDLKYLFENQDGNIQEDYIRNTPVYKYYLGDTNILNEYEFKREIWQSKAEVLERVREKRNKTIYINDHSFIIDGYKSICAGLAFDDLQKIICVKKIICSDEKKLKCVLYRERKEW